MLGIDFVHPNVGGGDCGDRFRLPRRVGGGDVGDLFCLLRRVRGGDVGDRFCLPGRVGGVMLKCSSCYWSRGIHLEFVGRPLLEQTSTVIAVQGSQHHDSRRVRPILIRVVRLGAKREIQKNTRFRRVPFSLQFQNVNALRPKRLCGRTPLEICHGIEKDDVAAVPCTFGGQCWHLPATDAAFHSEPEHYSVGNRCSAATSYLHGLEMILGDAQNPVAGKVLGWSSPRWDLMADCGCGCSGKWFLLEKCSGCSPVAILHTL